MRDRKPLSPFRYADFVRRGILAALSGRAKARKRKLSPVSPIQTCRDPQSHQPYPGTPVLYCGGTLAGPGRRAKAQKGELPPVSPFRYAANPGSLYSHPGTPAL